MSDVPEMPGPQNPFGPGGFDLQELMRMLQSPGPVNMEVARSTADATAVTDPDTGEQQLDPPPDAADQHAFDELVRAAQLAVAEATSISASLSVPARCVDRQGWSRATLAGLEPVFTSLATAIGRGQFGGGGPEASAGQPDAQPNVMSPDAFFGMLMQQLVPLLLGGWAGSMIGLLSHHALGQYDLPLPLAGDPAILFVVRNVDAFAGEWSLPNDELRYALTLREVVHGGQRAIPWVRERLVRDASAYVGAYEVRAEAIEEHFRGIDLTDPASMAGLEQLSDPQVLLGAMQSERQQPLLESLQRFVAVLEGYTDVVVAALGEKMVASHARIDEALRRHRLERGEAATFVDGLIGLQVDREHYDAGLAFCRGVVERSGGSFDQLNRLWSGEQMVPTPAELDAPGLWLARIDLPS